MIRVSLDKSRFITPDITFSFRKINNKMYFGFHATRLTNYFVMFLNMVIKLYQFYSSLNPS